MISQIYERGKVGPKNKSLSSKGVLYWFPESWVKDPDKPRCVLYVGHGIGERGKGTVEDLQQVADWGYFSQFRLAVDRNDIIVCFLNAQYNYEYSEHEAALNFTEANFNVIPEMNAYFGHSLGSYGFGRYVCPKLSLLKRFRIWFCSASGEYPATDLVFDNLVASGIIVVGITAENDTANRTDPIAVTQLYTEMKRRDKNAPVLLIEFPASTWTPESAHNAVCGRLNNAVLPQIAGAKTFGFNQPPKMSIYEFWLSNPPGSPFKTLSQEFTQVSPAPKPIPTPSPVPGKKVSHHHVYVTKGVLKVQRVYEDGSKEVLDIESKNANNLYVKGELHGTLSGPKGTTAKTI